MNRVISIVLVLALFFGTSLNVSALTPQNNIIKSGDKVYNYSIKEHNNIRIVIVESGKEKTVAKYYLKKNELQLKYYKNGKLVSVEKEKVDKVKLKLGNSKSPINNYKNQNNSSTNKVMGLSIDTEEQQGGGVIIAEGEYTIGVHDFGYQQLTSAMWEWDYFYIRAKGNTKHGFERISETLKLGKFMNAVDTMRGSSYSLIASGLTTLGSVSALLASTGPLSAAVAACLAIGAAVWYISELRRFDEARSIAFNYYMYIVL